MRSLVGCSPNARFQPLPEAGAERTLLAVGCKPLFGSGGALRILCRHVLPNSLPPPSQGQQRPDDRALKLLPPIRCFVPFLNVPLQAQRKAQALIDFVHERLISRTQYPQHERLLE